MVIKIKDAHEGKPKSRSKKKNAEAPANKGQGKAASASQRGIVIHDAHSYDPFSKKNYKRMKALLKERVSPRRFKHSKGVAKTARSLALIYNYPQPEQARMAGLLHDWDKGYVGQAARDRVAEFELRLDGRIVEDLPWLLHGITGAEALRREFPELGAPVFQAISRHTFGAVDMTELDMLIYIADLIEPNRRFSDVEGVRSLVGKVSLEDLFFEAFRCIFLNLIEHQRLLHPDMVEIWNHYAVKRSGAHKGRLSSTPDPSFKN